MKLNFAKAEFNLLPEAAIYWSKHKALILSDVHLAKACVFQNNGIPIPYGSSLEDLQRIQNLCSQYKVEKLWIIGDLLHGKITDKQLEAAIIKAFEAMNLVEYTLILGNHDRHRLNTQLFKTHTEFEIDGIMFSHDMQKITSKPMVLGHIHPVYRIKHQRQPIRLRCFYKHSYQLTLPAFGEFTGGYTIQPQTGDEIYAIVDHQVMQVF